MKLLNKKKLEEFENWDKEPPTHDSHGEDSWSHPITERMTQAKCWNWTLEGNLLKCDSDFGPFAQTIPTDYILKGEKDGLPILEKIVL